MSASRPWHVALLATVIALSTACSKSSGSGTSLPPPPAAPAALEALVLSSTSVELSWVDASTNETGFRLEHDGGGGFVAVGELGPNAVTTTVRGLQPLAAHAFRVRADGAGGASAWSNAASVFLPDLAWSTCAHVKASLPSAGDGPYPLFAGGDWASPWTAYCADLASAPIEYLELVGTAAGANFSQFSAGGISPGTDVRTAYARVRIAPSGFRVATGDRRFSSSRGALVFWGDLDITSMPYAAAVTCSLGSEAPVGIANVDLRGTPFATARGAFAIQYVGPAGQGGVRYGAEDQVVDLSISAQCGYVSPPTTQIPNNGVGGPLQLVYVGRHRPPAPTGLVARIASSTAVRLAWTDGGPGPAGFRIERDTGAGFVALLDVDAEVLTTVAQGLTPHATHSFRVRAHNLAGVSEPSNVASVFLPEYAWTSCAQVRASVPSAADGAYELYVGGDWAKPWSAYCADMDTAPLEYLELVATAAGSNFSGYPVGGFITTGTDVMTSYARVRLDPVTLRIDTGDGRFSVSTGSHPHGGDTVTSVCYATAMSCGGAWGHANVDLTGTPFSVSPGTLVPAGNGASGRATYGPGNRRVDLAGGGTCGWVAPVGAVDPFNGSGAPLPLVYSGW
jgi:hypothetical protein